MIIACSIPSASFHACATRSASPTSRPVRCSRPSEARKENAPELYAILLSQFETKPLSHWRGQFRTHDIKWSPLPTLEEAVRDPQMRDCGAIVNFDYPGHGIIETVNSPIFVAGSEKRKPQPPPDYGAAYPRDSEGSRIQRDRYRKADRVGVAVARDGK